MAYCGRSLVLINSGSYLHARSCLSCCSQSFSNKSTKFVEGQISPSKPKKPMSSFLLFLNDVRGKYKQEKPVWSIGEIAKRASIDWAELNSDKKQEYQKKFYENFEQYLKDIEEYKKSGFVEPTVKDVKTKKQRRLERKALGRPKKPLTPFLLYLLFMNQSRDKTINYKGWVKTQSDNWKRMTEADRKEYVTRAETLMQEYKRNVESWKQNMTNLDHSETVKNKSLQNDG